MNRQGRPGEDFGNYFMTAVRRCAACSLAVGGIASGAYAGLRYLMER